jgi:hypothetical protein
MRSSNALSNSVTDGAARILGSAIHGFVGGATYSLKANKSEGWWIDGSRSRHAMPNSLDPSSTGRGASSLAPNIGELSGSSVFPRESQRDDSGDVKHYLCSPAPINMSLSVSFAVGLKLLCLAGGWSPKSHLQVFTPRRKQGMETAFNL